MNTDSTVLKKRKVLFNGKWVIAEVREWDASDTSGNWKFSINLTKFDTSRLNELGIPSELKEFIQENNAAYPRRFRIEIGGVKRVLHQMLTFNDRSGSGFYPINEDVMDLSYYDLIRDWEDCGMPELVKENKIFPFAYTADFDLFCYSMESKTIVFYICKDNTCLDTNLTLEKFEESLW